MNSSAVLLLAYGGPNSLHDVPAFLREVRGGQPISQIVIDETTRRYRLIGGRSPLLDITRRLAAKLQNQIGLPVYVGAWMSKRLDLLSQCVGYTIPEDTPYDPIANLPELQKASPDSGLYLALLGFKTQFPRLKELWK